MYDADDYEEVGTCIRCESPLIKHVPTGVVFHGDAEKSQYCTLGP